MLGTNRLRKEHALAPEQNAGFFLIFRSFFVGILHRDLICLISFIVSLETLVSLFNLTKNVARIKKAVLECFCRSLADLPDVLLHQPVLV